MLQFSSIGVLPRVRTQPRGKDVVIVTSDVICEGFK